MKKNTPKQKIPTLREIREELKKGTVHVAAECNVSQRSVEQWERKNGTGISLENILPASKAYGFATTDEFLEFLEKSREISASQN